MDDLMINAMCAKAMGIFTNVKPFRGTVLRNYFMEGNREHVYDPLHDDAQCFALVKKFRIELSEYDEDEWEATISKESPEKSHWDIVSNSTNADLNRAICECVANMKGK